MEKTENIITAEKEAIETAVFCAGCGDKIDGEAKEQDGETFCESCFKDRFAVCLDCGEVIEKEDSYEVDGETYCETCLNDSFFPCPDCGEYKPADGAVTVRCWDNQTWRVDEKTVCDSCADHDYIKCTDCGTYVPEYQSYYTGHDYSVCHDCYERNYGTCDECNDIFHSNNLIYSERREETFCESCFKDRFAVCLGCGEVITDEWTFEKDGEVFCRSCFESDFVKCSGCNYFIKTDDASYHNGETYCKSCFKDRFAVCPGCGEVIEKEDSYEVDGETYCETCFADLNCIKCADCGAYVPEDQSYYTGHGYYVCFDCYESNYGTCAECNDIFHSNNLIYSERREETFCESCYHDCGCGSIQDYHYKPSPKYRHFNQTTNKTVFSRCAWSRLYLGFELEVESRNGSPDSVAGNLIEDYDDGEDLFYCKHDNSLEHGFEIVSHPLTLRAHKVQDYSDMLQSLKQAGCRSHDVNTCGLHVHVSRSFFTPSEMVKLGLFVYFNKSRLETFARRTESAYAKFKPVPKNNLQAAGQSEDRYEAINFENRSTIEFRLFKGTLNFETFLATLEFCDAVSRFVKTVSACSIVNKNGGFDLFKSFVKKDGNRKLYKNLIDYLTARGL